MSLENSIYLIKKTSYLNSLRDICTCFLVFPNFLNVGICDSAADSKQNLHLALAGTNSDAKTKVQNVELNKR